MMYVIGEVMTTHGVKGEVKVRQISDFIDRFSVGETVYYKVEDRYEPLVIDGFRMQQQTILLHFDSLPSINDVQFLRGHRLYIDEQQQETLSEHEYYYHEIIGCNVVTDEGVVIGTVDSILTTGANDVWVVKNEQGQEVLIPFIKDVVQAVDIVNKRVTIVLMDGLID